jgi:predicted alpha/beta hydrolase
MVPGHGHLCTPQRLDGGPCRDWRPFVHVVTKYFKAAQRNAAQRNKKLKLRTTKPTNQ